jgi:hypothetical protein
MKRPMERVDDALEQKLRTLIAQSACGDREAFWQAADEIRRRTAGRQVTDSTALIREDRDAMDSF